MSNSNWSIAQQNQIAETFIERFIIAMQKFAIDWQKYKIIIQMTDDELVLQLVGVKNMKRTLVDSNFAINAKILHLLAERITNLYQNV